VGINISRREEAKKKVGCTSGELVPPRLGWGGRIKAIEKENELGSISENGRGCDNSARGEKV